MSTNQDKFIINDEKKIPIKDQEEIKTDKKKKKDINTSKTDKKKISEPSHGYSKDNVTQGLSNDETSIGGPDVFMPIFPDQ